MGETCRRTHSRRPGCVRASGDHSDVKSLSPRSVLSLMAVVPTDTTLHHFDPLRAENEPQCFSPCIAVACTRMALAAYQDPDSNGAIGAKTHDANPWLCKDGLRS